MQSNDMDIMVIIINETKQNQQPDRAECITGEEISLFSHSSYHYGDCPLTKLLPISLTFGKSVKVAGSSVPWRKSALLLCCSGKQAQHDLLKPILC